MTTEHEAAIGQSDSTVQLGLLPIGPHDHPEPHTMMWSELELRAIKEYAARCVAAERERCAKLCDLHSRLTWNDDRKAQSRVLAAEIRRGPNAGVKAAAEGSPATEGSEP